jgi:hypothetical protein
MRHAPLTFSFGCTNYNPSQILQTMKTNLNYCIVLSSEQLAYLAGSKYGIDRMKILHRLVEAAVLEKTEYAIKGFSTTLQVGQAILSEVNLSSKLGYDKKTISRVLDKMNRLGIVASTQSNRTSVHTLKCISAWMLDGNRIDNPFYVRLKGRQEKGKNAYAMSDDTVPVLPMTPQKDSDSCMEENFLNSKDGRQTNTMEKVCVSDTDLSFVGKSPVISDDGELLSPSSSFPLVSVSPQLVAEEESDKDISENSPT